MKKLLLLLLLIPFFFSCEKVEPEKNIHIKTSISYVYSPDFTEMNIIFIQHQIDTEGIIYLHNYKPGIYKINDLNFDHYIDCNWGRIMARPYKTNLILHYKVNNDTIKRVLVLDKQQIGYGDNYFYYKINPEL